MREQREENLPPMREPFMLKQACGRSRSIGNCLLSLWIYVMAIVALCYGCHYDPLGTRYLKEPPPKTDICGVWSIDSDRTNWHEAMPFIQSGRQVGRLTIWLDGTFFFEEMPDFSLFGFCDPPAFHHYGTGRWWTSINTEDVSYLWLDIEKMDGQRQERVAGVAHFLREGGKYFLYCTVRDPDSDEVLVLKKVD